LLGNLEASYSTTCKNMANIRDVIHQRNKNRSGLAEKKNVTRGVTVNIDYPDNPSVAGRPGYAWVRENAQDGGIFQCFNPVVKNVGGLPVIISRGSMKSSMRVIEGIDWSSLAIVISDTEGVALQLPNHHRDHEWPNMYPGLDVVHVYPRALVPLQLYVGSLSLTISVAPGKYIYEGAVVDFIGLYNDDISGYVPTTEGYYVILLAYINPITNLVEYVSGTEVSGPSPEKPSVPNSTLPIAFIMLYEGMTDLTEVDIIEDSRPIFTLSGGSGGGDVTTAVLNTRMAWMEAEWDYELTRHVVEG